MATAAAPPDTGLVARLGARDRAAWEELYRAHEERLYAFAHRLTGTPHAAADLVRETVVRAVPRLAASGDGADVAGCLLATATGLFLQGVDAGEGPGRTGLTVATPDPVEAGAAGTDPARAAAQRRRQEAVGSANAGLAPRERLVLALRELGDRSDAQIGGLAGLGEHSVGEIVAHARQGLRDRLGIDGLDAAPVPCACAARLPALSGFLDGRLAGAERNELDLHLRDCPTCRRALAGLRDASALYRALAPTAPAGLFGRVDAALAATGLWDPPRLAAARRAGRRARRPAAWVLAAGLVALAVGGGAVYPLAHRPGYPRISPTERLPPAPPPPPVLHSPANPIPVPPNAARRAFEDGARLGPAGEITPLPRRDRPRAVPRRAAPAS